MKSIKVGLGLGAVGGFALTWHLNSMDTGAAQAELRGELAVVQQDHEAYLDGLADCEVTVIRGITAAYPEAMTDTGALQTALSETCDTPEAGAKAAAESVSDTGNAVTRLQEEINLQINKANFSVVDESLAGVLNGALIGGAVFSAAGYAMDTPRRRREEKERQQESVKQENAVNEARAQLHLVTERGKAAADKLLEDDSKE